MRREQKQQILADLKKKMVFIVGPRQVGKTYLAKEVMKEYKNPLYLNYDFLGDKKKILQNIWTENNDLVVLDEIHKMPKWKNFIKGVFDVKSPRTHLLVTGSARLDTFRKAGDSMAGRFFIHHLLPISLKEMKDTDFKEDLDRLILRSGFPEPFLAETPEDVARWRNAYIDRLIKQDILDFSKIEKLNDLKNVLDILATKVGSEISYENIAGDLSISPKTVKKYIDILEALYIVFLVRPFSGRISRTIRKAPKVYFYDTGLLQVDQGRVFENLVGLSLLKHVYGLQDVRGQKVQLMYIRDKEKREVDFVLVEDKKQILELIEVKLAEDEVDKNLLYFSSKYDLTGTQVIKNLRQKYLGENKIKLIPATNFLENLFL